jgi:hypothetical protein
LPGYQNIRTLAFTAVVAAPGLPADVVSQKEKALATELSPNFGDGVKDQAAAWA